MTVLKFIKYFSNKIVLTFYLILFVFINSLSSSAKTHIENKDKIEWTPFQIALFSPYQLFNEKYEVYGIRFNLLYGSNIRVYGFDFGIVNHSMKTVSLQIGIKNIIKSEGFPNDEKDENSFGMQIAIANHNWCHYHGFQLGLLYNWGIDFIGFQASILNLALGEIYGIQIGLGNITCGINGIQCGVINYMDGGGSWFSCGHNEVNGVQIAILINRSESVCGSQIGIFNSADRVKGIQIGLINYARRMCGVQIGVINIIQEGFIPIFPIFNVSCSF